MSESHGTVLIVKRHEDLPKVAAYVKQHVREELKRIMSGRHLASFSLTKMGA